mgnify:CR=1 FL=1
MPVCFARQRNADRKSQMMTNALQTNWENNLMRDLLTSEMYEFICGGSAIVSEEWDSHNGVEDSYTFPVNPAYFFYESKGNDPRHWDDSLIGEIRDYTLGNLPLHWRNPTTTTANWKKYTPHGSTAIHSIVRNRLTISRKNPSTPLHPIIFAAPIMYGRLSTKNAIVA